MAVKKIPTYDSNKQVRSTFDPPKLQSAIPSIMKSMTDMGHNILDKQAAEEGELKGYQEYTDGTTQKDIKQITNKTEFTIRGQAYQKGAQNAFIAKTSQETDEYLGRLAIDEKVLLEHDGEWFETEANKYLDKVARNTPAKLQSLLLPAIQKKITGYTTEIAGKKVISDAKKHETIQLDVLDINKTHIKDLISQNGEAFDKFGESLGIIKGLVEQGYTDEANLKKLKDQLILPVYQGEIIYYFNSLPDDEKVEFANKIANQGVDYFVNDNELIAELQKEYTKEVQKVLPNFQFGRPTDTQLGKMFAVAIADWKKGQEKNESFINYAWKNFSSQIENAWKDHNTTIEQEIPRADIEKFITVHDIDKTDGDTLLRNWEIFNQAELQTIGFQDMSLAELTNKINDNNEALKKLGNETEQDLMQYEILNMSNGVFATQINSIKQHKEDDTLYKFLTPDFKTDTVEDYIARRNLVAKKLGVNPESLGMFDKDEQDALKDFLKTTSTNDLISGANLLEKFGLDLNNTSVLQELGIDANTESILMLSQNKTSQKILAQSVIRFDTNETKLKGTEQDDAIKDEIDKLFDDENLTSLAPQDYSNTHNIIKTIAYDIVANSNTNEETAVKQAYDLFKKAYEPTKINFGGGDQTILVPAPLKEKFDLTKSYIEDMIGNEVKYGLFLPKGKLIEQIDFSKVYFEQRNGKLVMVQKDDDGFTTVPIQVKGAQNESGNISLDRIAISMDPDGRYVADKNNYKNSTWDHPITSKANEILSAPKVLNNEYKDDAVSDLQMIINDLKEEIAEIDAGQGPDAIKHALKMGPEQKLNYYQSELQNLITDKDINPNANEDFEISYFKLAYESEFADPFTQHITNNSNQQMTISGILLKNSQPNSTWTEDELIYLSGYSGYNDLLDPAVRQYVVDNWAEMRDNGGFETLRTGYKLTPAGTLYVLVQDAVNDTSQ